METKFPSPGGTYLFQIFPWEVRMSLWVETPRLIETASGRTLFDPLDSHWSLDEAIWLDEARVKCSLRRYPGDHTPSVFEVIIDCQKEGATLANGVEVALSSLAKQLEATYFRSRVT